jgi:hypothetical protein
MTDEHVLDEVGIAYANQLQLLDEAAVLAQRINLARFEFRIPSSEDTVRLCEILDMIAVTEE